MGHLERRVPRPRLQLLIALVALVALSLADNWRIALMVALAAAAVAATRIRYATEAAAALALVVAALALVGGPIGDDERAPAHGEATAGSTR